MSIHDNSEVPCQLVEKMASKMAVTFNGGAWDTHYTEAQKERWRAAIRNTFYGEYARLKNGDDNLLPFTPKTHYRLAGNKTVR